MPWEKKEPEKVEPPCETCRVDLMLENLDAAKVFNRCSDEWLTAGMDGARLAIPGPSIESAMNATKIFDQDRRTEVYDAVKIMSRAAANAMAEERERRRREHEEGK